jgi:hypothetical protein
VPAARVPPVVAVPVAGAGGAAVTAETASAWPLLALFSATTCPATNVLFAGSVNRSRRGG